MKHKTINILMTALVALVLGASTFASEFEFEAKRGGGGPKKIGECRTIYKPGSYVVTRNLVAKPEQDCLVIATDDITLDLGGFRLIGSTDDRNADEAGVGITDRNVRYRQIVIRNGIIKNFSTAINLATSFSIVIEDLIVPNGPDDGILLGPSSIVRNSIILAGGFQGSAIVTGARSIVSGNIASGGEEIGIQTGPNSVINSNVASGGFNSGIEASRGSVVSGNSARSGNVVGISVDCPSTVIGNFAEGGPNLSFNGDDCVDANNSLLTD